MFKDFAHRAKNFKNIPKTMAFHHQELICYYINSGSDRSPLRPSKEWDQQLCARFPIPYERDCGERFHYSNEEVGKII